MLFRKLLALTTTAGLFSRHILLPAGLLLLAIGPASATTFSALVVFGDSTVDSTGVRRTHSPKITPPGRRSRGLPDRSGQGVGGQV